MDYNASAPIEPRVLEKMVEIFQNYAGNADSRTHDYGERARDVVENARRQVASLLGISAAEVFFTSGATESNNIAIQGLSEYARQTGKKHIITTAIEHKAVLETVKAMEKRGFDVDLVAPKPSGRVDETIILDKVRKDTLLVSVMHVNNETGMIQPVKEIGEVLSKRGTLFHVDATQSCGKLVDELREIRYNMLSFSAHKLRGPQGVGVLALRKASYKLPPVKPLMYGGEQEHGIRPGTVPVALVAGCGLACEIAEQEYKENTKRQMQIKTEILRLLDESGIKYKHNGDPAYCIENTLNICFPGVNSEALMISAKQYCSVSNGSACTSKSYSPSYVLAAMGITEDEIENSIRISWGPETDEKELVEKFKIFLTIAKSLVS